MPNQLLTFLKYLFLVVLYLFFVRVLRAVWTELREPKAVAVAAAAPPSGFTPTPTAAVSRKARTERLTVRQPSERNGQVFDLNDELTVGRAADCGVSLPEDTFVSHRHARLFRQDGDVYLEDFGSTNGTYVNGKRVTGQVVLRRGDQVQVGKTVLEVTK